jgi:hypothetical protein
LENSKQSRKPLFVATGLTVLALIFSIFTVSILVGTTYGLVFIAVLVTGLVLLGSLYVRLLTSSSFSSSISKIETKASKINLPNNRGLTINIDSLVLENRQEKISLKTNGKKSKKLTSEDKEELESSSQIISEIRSPIIITQKEKCTVFGDANLQQKSKDIERENHKNSGTNKKDVPEGCNNFLGYLGTLPKSAATPDECFACAQLIDCHKKRTC